MAVLLRRPFTEEEAQSAAAWRYPAPFDVYDTGPGSAQTFRTRTAAGEGYYPAVDDRRELVAFAVLGAEARVRGQQPVDGTVDLGLGVRPEATSRGLGTDLVRQAVELATDLFAPRELRAAVAVFNERSLSLCARAGFRPVRDFPGPGGRPFRELVLALDQSA